MLDLCASVFMVRRMMTPRLQAAQAGESRYHGRPCKTCGTTLRYVLNCTCVECHRARAVGRSREQRRRMAEMLRAGKEARKLRQRKPKAGGQ